MHFADALSYTLLPHGRHTLDKDFRINRVSEQKNVSPYMVPSDRTVLCIELSLWKDEPMWQWSDEEIYKLALRDLMKSDLRRKKMSQASSALGRTHAAEDIAAELIELAKRRSG